MSLSQTLEMDKRPALLLVIFGSSILSVPVAAQSNGLSWNGTFDPSTLISALLIVVSIIGSAIWLKADVREAKQDVAEMKPLVGQIPQLASDVKEMKPQVAEIRAVQNQQVNDGRRMDAMQVEINTLREIVYGGKGRGSERS